MGKKSSGDSTDRKSWDKLFKTLVKILQTKQDEVESLLKDRKVLEDKLKSQHENWISDARNHEEQLSLMNREIETREMMQFFETAKCSLLSGFKERDHSLCNLKLEQTVDERDDFKAWFDFLTLNTNKESGSSSLEAEMRKLKLEYEKLASEKKREVSDLSRENGFVWSQLKCIESGFTDKLKKREDEISQANSKIASLLSFQEQLQSSNQEKDEVILSLKGKVAEMEMDSRKRDEEISKLSRERESLKKSRSFTPVLTRCTTRDKGNNSNTVSTKKEKLAASTPNQEEIKSAKRKRENKTTPATVSVIPKLFTSTFRLPKLKSPPSGVIG